MSRTRSEAWFFAFFGLTVAVFQFLDLRGELWPQLGVADWVILALLLVAPFFAVWHHFRHVREITTEASNTGIRLALGGYVPLWFGLSLLRRVLN